MAPRAKDLALSLMTFLWFTILLFRASAQIYGIAIFYTSPYKPSACYGFEDQGVMIAAASEAIWNGGTTCGQHYQVVEAPQRDEPRCPKAMLWKRFGGDADCGPLHFQCMLRNYRFVTRSICIYSGSKCGAININY